MTQKRFGNATNAPQTADEPLTDLAAERATLAGVFQYGSEAYADASDLISATTFTDETNQVLWGCYSHCFAKDPNSRLDFGSVLSAANSLGVASIFDSKESKDYLRSISNFPSKKENVRKLAGKIRKLEFLRRAAETVKEVHGNILRMGGDEPIDEILGSIENPILDVSSLLLEKHASGPSSVGKGLREYVKYLADNPVLNVGITTGFKFWDDALGGGFRDGTVNLVGARSGVGKSLFANNVGIRVAAGSAYEWPKIEVTDKIPVLQLDTEMTEDDQRPRQLAMVSGVPIRDIERGIFGKDAKKVADLNRAVDLFERIPYDFMNISGQPFGETEATMRRWITKKVGLKDDGTAKKCLLIFDYLKLMDSASLESGNLAEFQVLGFMMTRLHNFAVRFRIPILTFVQLNRDGIDQEDSRVVSQSDRILWLCSNFSIYKAKSDEEMMEQLNQKVKYNRKLVTVKTRHGGGVPDGKYINMFSKGETAFIAEGPLSGQNSLANGATGPDGALTYDAPIGQLVL